MNMSNEIYDSLTKFETIPVPALDIEEIIQERRWNKIGGLSPAEKRVLAQGKEFIGLVKIGEEIVRRTIVDGTLSSDLTAICAYSMVDRACDNGQSSKSEDLGTIINIANKVMTSLSNLSDPENKYIGKRDLRITRNLFLNISR